MPPCKKEGPLRARLRPKLTCPRLIFLAGGFYAMSLLEHGNPTDCVTAVSFVFACSMIVLFVVLFLALLLRSGFKFLELLESCFCTNTCRLQSSQSSILPLWVFL